jgi:hypothetical protein
MGYRGNGHAWNRGILENGAFYSVRAKGYEENNWSKNNSCADYGLARATIANDKSILLSERMLHKDYNRRYAIEKKNCDRDSQGACLQDEMIGGKPPVVK